MLTGPQYKGVASVGQQIGVRSVVAAMIKI